MTIKYSEDAILDIEQAVLWYQNIRKELSTELEHNLDNGIESICRNPDSFQKKYKNIRIYFIRKFPYGIHYLVIDEEILVLGVFHTSRNPTSWFPRITNT